MYAADKTAHRETIERYCYVIDKNTALCRSMADGKVYYECMNRHDCEKIGGCKNSRFSECSETDSANP